MEKQIEINLGSIDGSLIEFFLDGVTQGLGVATNYLQSRLEDDTLSESHKAVIDYELKQLAKLTVAIEVDEENDKT